jgi:hypothetical protein
MANPSFTFSVRAHVVGVERVDERRYIVTIDGSRFASFCSESRARSAGRTEARRRYMIEGGVPRGSGERRPQEAS